MLLIGIPSYNSRATLRDALNSLCAQTRHNFITVICDDCSDDPCDDIIEEFSKRLTLRKITTPHNGGPGFARQTIIDYNESHKPNADYIMFMDADDILYPRAVDLLYTEAKKNNADIVSGQIFCEKDGQDGFYLTQGQDITWFHGKCYRANYLRENNIRFHPDLRYNEDSYFNLIAHLLTDNKRIVQEPVYLWRNNCNSITRTKDEQSFSEKYNYLYLFSQVAAAQKIITTKYAYKLTATFANIYKSYELLVLQDKEKIEWANNLIYGLFIMPETYQLFCNSNFMHKFPDILVQGILRENKLIFFPHSFSSWCAFFGIKLGG